ncbi:MAG: threonine/serine dehydratase [Hyphomicrobiaceae bacterium]
MRPDEIPAAVEAAHGRIARHIIETPLRRSPALSLKAGADVALKLENVQVTSSFKARGATNKVMSLSAGERARGIVTASSGNHGAATAHALGATGTKGLVFIPRTTPEVKVAAIRMLGAEVRFHDGDSGGAEIAARQHAEENGLTFISPYNDPDVIAGQGTIGLEILKAMPDVGTVVVSVGGGGLISGIAGYLKARKPDVRIIGASPANDHALCLSVKAGRVVEHVGARDTLSDGTAGGVEPEAITLPLAAALVDDWVLVSEEEIADAMRFALSSESQMIEGAAGVAIAAFGKRLAEAPQTYRGRRTAIVVCGSRIDPKKLTSIIR